MTDLVLSNKTEFMKVSSATGTFIRDGLNRPSIREAHHFPGTSAVPACPTACDQSGAILPAVKTHLNLGMGSNLPAIQPFMGRVTASLFRGRIIACLALATSYFR